MGLFANPLSHAGYPPGVTGTPTTQPSEVRAATAAEVSAGTLTNCYVSPATVSSLDAGLFASPPALGSTTPNAVSSTTLTSSGNTTLATGAAATTISLGNVAPSGARTTTILGGAQAQNDTLNVLSGTPSAGTQTMNVFTGTATGGTQVFNLFGTGATRAGTINLGTGAAAHVLNIASSGASIGFFGTAAAAKQTQGAITNNVTSGGSTGVIADFTDLTTYATDAATIRNDIYQLALGLQGCIAALRTYGLLG